MFSAVGAYSGATLLQSWKEIAAYLCVGVRTVQRWEDDFEFPVHRIDGTERHAVFAIPHEIDDWLHHRAAIGKSFRHDHAKTAA